MPDQDTACGQCGHDDVTHSLRLVRRGSVLTSDWFECLADDCQCGAFAPAQDVRISRARQIGESHAREGKAPWDMHDADSALLADAVGITEVTDANAPLCAAVCDAYDQGYDSVPLSDGQREHLAQCGRFPCESCSAYARRAAGGHVWGACGVQDCTECRPLFDADNRLVAGT